MKKILLLFTVILIMGMLMCGAAFADTGPADPESIKDLITGLTVEYAVVIVGILGIFAFAVELIVQLTKEVPFIRNVPTKLYVIIVSLLVTELALFIYTSWARIAVLWYYVVLTAFMAFVTAYIAIFGWDTLKELYLRYAKLKE